MRTTSNQSESGRLSDRYRKGVFLVLAAVCLIAAMIFVGMSVDLGMITVTKTRMQGAADAAALAATQEILAAVRETVSFKPAAIIQKLDLLKPVYYETAAYGHFGRRMKGFTWENTDLADKLKAIAK